MTDKALEAALPGEAEVDGEIRELAAWLIERSKPDSGLTFGDNSRGIAEATVTGYDAAFVAEHFHGPGAARLADALQAMQARAEKAERKNKELRTQDDPRYVHAFVLRAEAAEARVKVLEAENARLRRLDAEYGRVETAIIMADPDFDGDSPHDNCGDRLIASVHRLRDLAALKGGSNG